MLVGAVISSTDAASVFSVLSTSKLNLKNNVGHLLEMESGTNDPVAYTLTILFITLVVGNTVNIPLELFIEISLGLFIGLVVGKIGIYIINKIEFEIDGLYSILIIGLALFSYSFAYELGGNGFLSVFLTGILLGNNKIIHHDSMLKYFDGISWLMQITLFLTLSLLVTPSHLPNFIFDGIVLAVFIIFIARPLIVFICLSFSKYSFKDKIIISWAGFRGAVSLVFTCYVLVSDLPSAQWIFNVVFIVALISLLLQGITFIPIAEKLDMIEEEKNDDLFDNYLPGSILEKSKRVLINKDSPLVNKKIIELDVPEELKFVMIKT